MSIIVNGVELTEVIYAGVNLDTVKVKKGTAEAVTVFEKITQLATPQNVTANGTTVSWDEVANATSYAMLADGNEIGILETGATDDGFRIAVDLTTLPGWEGLSPKSYNITIVAKADGYRDSEPSAAVSVEKITWENPTQDGDILTITQVYTSIQSGNDLSIE